jgi:hypothetical protein
LSEIQKRGDDCPKHWKQEDPNIKRWIQEPAVLDAFTMLVLGAWTIELLPMPPCVAQQTKQFCGSASEKEFDRFAEVVQYDANTSCPNLFVDEIKLALEQAGVKDVSSHKIGIYVTKHFGLKSLPPVYSQFRKNGKKGYGFSHLRLADVVAFDGLDEKRAASLRKTEMVRQQVRNGDSELGKRTFDHLCQADVVVIDEPDEKRAASLGKTELVRQQVRNGDSELGKRTFDHLRQADVVAFDEPDEKRAAILRKRELDKQQAIIDDAEFDKQSLAGHIALCRVMGIKHI